MARILFARILVTRSICLETCGHISILFLFMSFETGSHYESLPDMKLTCRQEEDMPSSASLVSRPKVHPNIFSH